VAASSLLYVAFEERIDRCVTFALERMTGLRVEAGLVDESEFRRAHAELLGARFPKARMLEAGNLRGLVLALSSTLERVQPAEAKIVRMHDFFWLRMWHASDGPGPAIVEDVLCSLTQLQ
jgi:hypothetical protein